MPLRILRLRGLINASLVRAFLVTGMYSTFFLGTLYLEHVRHYSALTGAAFLPWTITVAVLLQGITARLVKRFGSLPVLTVGMATAIVGLRLFAAAGAHTTFFPTIFIAGAAAIAAGMWVFLLLPHRGTRPALRVADAPAARREVTALNDHEIKKAA